jgi:hypothetical protein
VSLPGAEPPTITLCASRSSQLLTLVELRAMQTLSSLVTLPIQLNFVMSNLAASMPISGMVTMPRLGAPSTVPSCGETL